MKIEYSKLYTFEKLAIIFVFVFPIAITTNEFAQRAKTSDVNPFYIFATTIQRDANGNIKNVRAANTFRFFKFSVFQKLFAIADQVLHVTARARSHRNTFFIVNLQLKSIVTANANCSGEMFGNVTVGLAVADEFFSYIFFGVCIVFSTFTFNHKISSEYSMYQKSERQMLTFALLVSMTKLHAADAHHDFAERNFVADVDGLWRVVVKRFVVDARFVRATQMSNSQSAVFEAELRVLAMHKSFVLIAQVDVGINAFFVVFAPDQNFGITQHKLLPNRHALLDREFHRAWFHVAAWNARCVGRKRCC